MPPRVGRADGDPATARGSTGETPERGQEKCHKDHHADSRTGGSRSSAGSAISDLAMWRPSAGRTRSLGELYRELASAGVPVMDGTAAETLDTLKRVSCRASINPAR